MGKNEYKDIPNHDGYFISEHGVVVYDKGNRMKRIAWNSVTVKDKVFLYTNMRDDNGKRHRVYMHKLVAEVFVPNPHGYHDVKHIDGNTMNNSIDNLMWYDSVADFIEKHKELKVIRNLPNYLISNDGKLYTSTSQKRLRENGIPFEFLVKVVRIRSYKNNPYVKVNVKHDGKYVRKKMFISDFIVNEQTHLEIKGLEMVTIQEHMDIINKFNIKLKYVTVQDENGSDIKNIILGGNEVINSRRCNDCKKVLELTVIDDIEIICEDTEPLFYKYVDTGFSVDKLKELLKYKSIKSLSKEKALEINASIKSKQELENDIVYITDKEPMTNSLALAKQFELNHTKVVEKIYELGSMYPSVLMKIRYDVYSSTIKQSSKVKSVVSDDRPRVEFSTRGSKTITERETYDTFIHIPEDVYYQFVKKISTPMNVNSDDPKKRRIALTRLTHIEAKQDEYFESFKKLRDSLHDMDIKSKELDSLIKTRTRYTSELISEIYNHVARYNSARTTGKLNVVLANRFIFNIVNHINGINAVNYVPPTEEEIKLNKTRKTKEEELQEKLVNLEVSIARVLNIATKHNLSLADVMMSACGKTEDELKAILKEYNVNGLWDDIQSTPSPSNKNI